MEGGPLTLILSNYGGISLCHRRERHRTGFKNSVTESEGYVFIATLSCTFSKGFFDSLQSIHDAGFRNGDTIRRTPCQWKICLSHWLVLTAFETERFGAFNLCNVKALWFFSLLAFEVYVFAYILPSC